MATNFDNNEFECKKFLKEGNKEKNVL